MIGCRYGKRKREKGSKETERIMLDERKMITFKKKKEEKIYCKKKGRKKRERAIIYYSKERQTDRTKKNMYTVKKETIKE